MFRENPFLGILTCLFIKLLIYDSCVAQLPYNTSSLLYVHVVFRHGDRTPDSYCPFFNPGSNESYWPDGFGALTLLGKNQEYDIGCYLRKRYDNWLGKIYYPEIVYARTTDFPRTKMSLQLVLAGLFPPAPVQRWNWKIHWQPIPYNYPTGDDKFVGFFMGFGNINLFLERKNDFQMSFSRYLSGTQFPEKHISTENRFCRPKSAQLIQNTTNYSGVVMSRTCVTLASAPKYFRYFYGHFSVGKDIHLMGFPLLCPEFRKEFDRVYDSSEVQTLLLKDKALLKFLTDQTGPLSVNPVVNVYYLHNCLYVWDYLSVPLPAWAKFVYPFGTKDLALKFYLLNSFNSLLTKLSGGQLLGKILSDAEAMINNQFSPMTQRISLFSGHEYNIAHLLLALGVFSPPQWPNYGSYIILELHEMNGIYGYKIFFQNSKTGDPTAVTIPGCAEFCPLAEVKRLLADNIPDEKTNGMC